MASPIIYSHGLDLSGTVFAGGPPLTAYLGDYFSAPIIWLDNTTGLDANAGTLPQLPVKTMQQAVTNSVTGGVIVAAAGSSETGLSITFNVAGLSVIGMGTGITRPRYTPYPGADMFDATVAGVRFYNLYFPASGGVPNSRIRFTAAEGGVRNCYFENGANDTGVSAAVLVHTAATSCRIRDTYFVSTASRPARGLLVDAAVTDLSVEGCIFDGGSFGWSSSALSVTAAATRMRFENVQMLRQSNFNVSVTATTYQALGLVSDGSSSIFFTA